MSDILIGTEVSVMIPMRDTTGARDMTGTRGMTEVKVMTGVGAIFYTGTQEMIKEDNLHRLGKGPTEGEWRTPVLNR
jgi:hypothetical protein